MTNPPDHVIVGAGLTGAVIARVLADAGKSVLVLERNGYPGGKSADRTHEESRIRFNLHGPHYFRTNSPKMWSFLKRFSEFYPFSARVLVKDARRYHHWPLSVDAFGELPPHSPEGNASGANFEEEMLRNVPEAIYRKFIAGYTRKHWGTDPKSLSPELARRIDPREAVDDRLTLHKFQGLPRNGFSRLIESMLRGIPVLYNVDFLAARSSFPAKGSLIFTGSIDTFFDYRFGRLPYRGQKRVHKHLKARSSPLLPASQVNFPSPRKPFLRVLEWRHMLHPDELASCKGTLLTWERAIEAKCEDEREYPFPDSKSRQVYGKYAELARDSKAALFCGRLGSYRYLDMDHAIEEAWKTAEQILADPLASHPI